MKQKKRLAHYLTRIRWVLGMLTSLIIVIFIVQRVRATAPIDIVGTVTKKATGKPIADAIVWLLSKDSSFEQSVRTNERGEFVFSKVPENEYEVLVSKTGFAQVNVGIVPDGRERIQVNFELEPEGVIIGMVLDEQQNPIAEATVEAMQGNEILQLLTTGKTGGFRLGKLPGGTYTLRVEHPTFLSMERKDVVVKSGETTTDVFFRLSTGATLIFLIIDQSGSPIGNAHIRVLEKNTYTLKEMAFTDTNGVAKTMQALPIGKYVLEINRKGLQVVGKEIIVSRSGENRIKIQLGTDTVVHGQVTDHNGKPIAGASLTVLKDRDTIASVDTDDEGLYWIEGIPAGTYKIMIDKNQDAVLIEELTIADKQVIQKNFDERGVAVIQGKVIHSATGKPLPGAKVIFSRRGGALAEVKFAETDAKGEFQVSVQAGEYLIVAIRGPNDEKPTNFSDKNIVHITVAPGESDSVTLTF